MSNNSSFKMTTQRGNGSNEMNAGNRKRIDENIRELDVFQFFLEKRSRQGERERELCQK